MHMSRCTLCLRSVQRGYERIKAMASEGLYFLGTLQEVSHRVAENEKVQQGVEKVQKGLEAAKDTGKVVMEKTQQGIEAVKEKTREWRAGAGTAREAEALFMACARCGRRGAERSSGSETKGCRARRLASALPGECASLARLSQRHLSH